jgi:hypothetical protein
MCVETPVSLIRLMFIGGKTMDENNVTRIEAGHSNRVFYMHE